MSNRRGKRKTGRRLALVALGLVAAAILATAGGWLAFRVVPSWYVPVDVTREELSQVRNSLPNTYQALKDGALHGQPFTFTLSDRRLTQWIVAREELYPDAGAWLPDWLHDPVVVFADGECVLGARIDYRGWQTVLGVHLQAEVADDTIILKVAGVTAGALPIPLSRLETPIERFLRDNRLDPELMPDPVAAVVRRLQSATPGHLLAEGVSWENRFELRDTRLDLRIVSLSAENGQLHIRFQPY